MATPFPNIYHHRKVADTASKACDVCFKPSSSVLVTPENKDFFYVCPGHLKDKGFCSPIIDQAAIDAKKKRELKKEMDDEVEKVRKEFEERIRKEEKEREDDEKKDKKEEKKSEEKNPQEKKKADETTSSVVGEEPREFALKDTFYKRRVDKKRNAEIARRNLERLQSPDLFPSVPKDLP
ncbi:hypothetical protein B7494_g6586 [Chlorociboria aeruginascens]|nr:hypothetical protein B7494_g6586 [Chlorociboria aeruginascens]